MRRTKPATEACHLRSQRPCAQLQRVSPPPLVQRTHPPPPNENRQLPNLPQSLLCPDTGIHCTTCSLFIKSSSTQRMSPILGKCHDGLAYAHRALHLSHVGCTRSLAHKQPPSRSRDGPCHPLPGYEHNAHQSVLTNPQLQVPLHNYSMSDIIMQHDASYARARCPCLPNRSSEPFARAIERHSSAALSDCSHLPLARTARSDARHPSHSPPRRRTELSLPAPKPSLAFSAICVKSFVLSAQRAIRGSQQSCSDILRETLRSEPLFPQRSRFAHTGTAA